MIINNRNLRALLLASALCLALVWLSLAAAQSPGGAGTFTDSRDGKTYNTVKIGKQTWMAENLNYGTSSGSWCYNDRDSYCKKYGRLYEWETAKKTCPSGWHLPSRQEWEALVTYAGGYEAAGKRLKSTIGWNDSGSGTDDYGFSALPGGGRYYDDDSFHGAGAGGYWWAATENGAYRAYRRYMGHSVSHAGEDSNYKSLGLSARCVMDN